MSDPRATSDRSWSPPQRGVLIAFVLVFAIALLLRLIRDRLYVSNPPPPHAERFDELASRIDPNTATWQELAVLPQIGEKRAKEIVAYRESVLAGDANEIAFARPQDLTHIKGIGPAVIETLRPHLTFPATPPAAEISADPQNPRPPGP